MVESAEQPQLDKPLKQEVQKVKSPRDCFASKACKAT